MKEEIKKEEIAKLNTLSTVYTVLLLFSVVSPVPLNKFFGFIGFAVWAVLAGITLYLAVKIEKIKKMNNIQTYKEITAFMNGKRLDEIARYREEGKRPYQKILLVLSSGIIALLVCLLMHKLLY